jgi:large subunit ribosomal protein L17
MRHQRAGVHLSRTSAHRKALFANLVAALFNNERIRTTDAKAKETRRLAERTITWARRLGDVLTKKPDKRSDEEKARVVHAVRMARRMVRDRFAVLKLFDEIGPRYLSRPGGYTRLVKIGPRAGDAAPMSLLELIPADGAPAKKEETAPAAKGKAAKSEAPAAAPAKKGAAKASAEGGEKKAAAKKPAAKKSAEGEKKPAKAKKKSEE